MVLWCYLGILGGLDQKDVVLEGMDLPFHAT